MSQTMNVRYTAASRVSGGVDTSQLGLATNLLRPQGYLNAHVEHPERVREVLCTMHGVVVSDLRRKVRDRSAWETWLAQKDREFLLGLKTKASASKDQLEQIEQRLSVLDGHRQIRRKPFIAARNRYADYVVNHTSEFYWLFDPVVTVHPDEVFFEAFSKDESSYCRVGVSRSLLRDEGETVYGTTNIDFSKALARHLERLRNYRDTSLRVGPGGVDVQVDDVIHREEKIPLPESWVNGFLQVQATMTMGLTSLRLKPIELFNVLRLLTQKKARTSPKALRFELTPGKPVRIVAEPWEIAVDATSIYQGGGPAQDKPTSIRIWGRERLKLLARLLPMCTDIRVELAGFGLPSFWVLDLGGITFTLGLSGWTDNDWTGQSAKAKGQGSDDTRFELLTRRLDGKPEDLVRLYEVLRERRLAKDVDLASATGLSLEETRTSLSHLAQGGRATYDLHAGAYRHRDLFVDSFSLGEAKQLTRPKIDATASPTQKNAQRIFDGDGVRIIMRRPTPPDVENPGYKLSGSVKGLDGAQLRPQLHVDSEGQILTGSCTCKFFRDAKLTKGPCEHLLALRLAHMEKL